MQNDFQYSLVRNQYAANITVLIDGDLHVADDKHPNFDAIVDAVQNGTKTEDEVVDLFDPTVAFAAKFNDLSERVKVANGRVFVDQTEVVDAFADQIVRFVEDGVEDWKPLVAFLEKVYSNVSPGIRENLSRWLKAESFTILPNGNILGYRGLNADYTSKHAGPGVVNGVTVNGHLDNSVGNIVEIDAALVENNPAVGCASGLHVGTYSYASGWAGYGGVMVSVEVDPRHVRSVPYECNDSKMRVSKYKVLDTITAKTATAVSYDYDDAEYDEYADDDEDSFYY